MLKTTQMLRKFYLTFRLSASRKQKLCILVNCLTVAGISEQS